MICQFCHSTDDVQQKTKFVACRRCLTLQKHMKRDTGLFYDVMNRRYMSGIDVQADFADCNKLLVLDLHGVTDLLSKPVFAEMAAKMDARDIRIILLSYVGTTTQTRTDAQLDMIEYILQLPCNVRAFTCFHRGEKVELSNKGHFVQMLLKPDATIHFFDDSLDHVSAARAAGVTAHHVQTSDPTMLLNDIYSIFEM